MSSFVKPTDDPEVPGYRTELDPKHDDFNESLITDEAYLKRKALSDGADDELVDPEGQFKELEPDEHDDDAEPIAEYDPSELQLSEVDKVRFILEDSYVFRDRLTKSAAEGAQWPSLREEICHYVSSRLGHGSAFAQEVAASIRAHRAVTKDACSLPIISGPDLAQINFPPREFLVEGYIYAGGAQHALAGPPKEGKSSFLTEQIRCIASGEDFLGLKTAGVPVLYVCNEEQLDAVKQRFWEHNALSHPNVHILSQPGKVWTPDFAEELSKAVKQYRLKLLVIDTFNNCFDFEDENDNVEMKKKVDETRAWGNHEQCSTLLNLHTVKNGTSDPDKRLNIRNVRGASSIVGLVDVISMFAQEQLDKKTNTNRLLSLDGRIPPRTHMKIHYDFIAKRYSKVEGGELLSDYFLKLQAEEEAEAQQKAEAVANPLAVVDVELPFEPSEKQRDLMLYLVTGKRFSSQKYLADKFSVSTGSVSGLLGELEDAGYAKKRDGSRTFLVKSK